MKILNLYAGLGLHVFNAAFKIKQKKLMEMI